MDCGETIELEIMNELHYNCDECPSPIELLFINENEYTIEFKCVRNNHQKKLPIKDYINKMKQYSNVNINNDKCPEHNFIYESYCLNCKKHLCEECLKLRNHVGHSKVNIIEILPNKEELNMLKNKLKYFENEITKLENEKISKMKFKDNKFKEFKEDELDDKNDAKKENTNIIEKELKLGKDNNLNNTKKEYVNEIKENLGNDIKLENLTYLKGLTEFILNTYNNYSNNYYNSVNINIALESYYKSKENFNNKLNKEIKNISKTNQTFNFYSMIKENENQINDIIKLISILNEYEGKIKNMKLDYENKLQEKKEELNKRKIEYEKILNNDNDEIIINKQVNYNNGDKYEGELKLFKSYKKNGKGKYYYKNGEIFDGEWKNGIIEGKGIYYYNNGRKYEGQWKNGKREGRGILYYNENKDRKRDRYDGEWKNDKKDGWGILYYNNNFFDRYEGNFEDDSKKEGRYYYKDGSSIYEDVSEYED